MSEIVEATSKSDDKKLKEIPPEISVTAVVSGCVGGLAGGVFGAIAHELGYEKAEAPVAGGCGAVAGGLSGYSVATVITPVVFTGPLVPFVLPLLGVGFGGITGGYCGMRALGGYKNLKAWLSSVKTPTLVSESSPQVRISPLLIKYYSGHYNWDVKWKKPLVPAILSKSFTLYA